RLNHIFPAEPSCFDIVITILQEQQDPQNPKKINKSIKYQQHYYLYKIFTIHSEFVHNLTVKIYNTCPPTS
ncbi:hypothetical protein DTI11_23375, partial [Salmonella enterica subsp. enterica serovar Tennessee]|nr:hypothetical protein [Salmonella enterica subsp. enterica serovar Tennessee]EFN7344906.1 hypothetical protein [Escherichia coli O128:H2]EFN7958558.1 hypothetical protein [Escherichia coli]EFN9502327.1 hypothetical protein [Escherichia coli]EFO3383247.1 hypothetical protein [Escherichia coli]